MSDKVSDIVTLARAVWGKASDSHIIVELDFYHSSRVRAKIISERGARKVAYGDYCANLEGTLQSLFDVLKIQADEVNLKSHIDDGEERLKNLRVRHSIITDLTT